MKLIIVDDEIWTRGVIKSFGKWKELGIEIAGEAEDGAGALELIGKERPQIVITDMKMPTMDGVALLKKLETEYPYLKVIVVSGYDDFEYTKQAIKAKVCEYILKPVDQEELNAALRKCIREIKLEQEKNSLYAYSSSQTASKEVISLIMKYKKMLQASIAELNLSGTKALLELFSSELSREVSLNPEDLSKVLAEFITLVEEYIVASGYDIGEILNNLEQLSLNRQGSQSLEALFRELSGLFEITILSIGNKRKRKNKSTIYEIKDYIDANYTAYLTLESLSGAFFISKEYLSKAFKEELGINVTDYIVERRMDKAKELLGSSGLSYKNIAKAVGYEDISYFYKVFKRYYKISPGQMKQEGGQP